MVWFIDYPFRVVNPKRVDADGFFWWSCGGADRSSELTSRWRAAFDVRLVCKAGILMQPVDVTGERVWPSPMRMDRERERREQERRDREAERRREQEREREREREERKRQDDGRTIRYPEPRPPR